MWCSNKTGLGAIVLGSGNHETTPANLAWPPRWPRFFPPGSGLIGTISSEPATPTALLQRLHSEPPPGAPHLVDVMLLANDGEREEGAGIRGVILWNEELEKDAQRPSWGGSEAPREARGGTGGGTPLI